MRRLGATDPDDLIATIERVQLRVLALVGITTLALAACDTDDGRTMTEPIYPPPATTVPESGEPTLPGAAAISEPMTLTAPWETGGPIPIQFTCDGADVSPALSWSGVPVGTFELAFILTDLDADNFVHWVAVGADPAITDSAEASFPLGAVGYENSWGTSEWGGPCPPPGDEFHTYLLTMYALPQQLELPAGASPHEILTEIDRQAIDVASVSGTYARAEG